MNRFFFDLVSRGALAGALVAIVPAQQQATTLARAVDRAPVVVVATVTAATDPSPMWHRLEWRTDRVLKGQVAPTFALLEPAGACCGRSLFALRTGEQRLLFLDRRGPRLHPFGGNRGVLSVDASLLAHVQALLLNDTPATRGRLLARSLDHPSARVAMDAALALTELPSLDLDASSRGHVGRALRLAVQRCQTSSPALLDVALRTTDPGLLDTALGLYVTTKDRGQARQLRRGLLRANAGQIATRLPVVLTQEAAVEMRAAELLRALPTHQGGPALQSLLARTSCPRVKLCATEGLLAAGHPPRSLTGSVPAAILELAKRRVSALRFRTIGRD